MRLEIGVAAAALLICGSPPSAQAASPRHAPAFEPAPESVGETYYEGSFRSGYWYSHEAPRRLGNWNAAAGGYDCFKAFTYAWQDGGRVRYDSTRCFDAVGQDFEVRSSRVVARLD